MLLICDFYFLCVLFFKFFLDRYKNLKKEFLDADKSKDGNLTMPELEKYLVYKCDRIGLEYRKLEVDDIFRKMDENKNGVVTL